jgi:hypothetical protein
MPPIMSGGQASAPPSVGAPHEQGSTSTLPLGGPAATYDAAVPDTGGFEPVPAPQPAAQEASPLTAEEQALFPQAVERARSELASTDVRDGFRQQLQAAGLPAAEADVDGLVARMLASYATADGQRGLMDRAAAEGWFVQAGPPAWNDEWKAKFQDAMRERGIAPMAHDLTLDDLAASGADEAGLQHFHDRLVAGEAEEVESKSREAIRLTGGVSSGIGTVVSAGAGVVAIGNLGASSKLLVEGLKHMALTGTPTQAGHALNLLGNIGSGGAKAAITAVQAQVPNAAQLASSAGSLATSSKAASTFLTNFKGGNWLTRLVGSAPTAVLAATPPATLGNVLKASIGLPVTGAGVKAVSGLAKWAGPVAMVGVAALHAMDIKNTMDAEGGFGKFSQQKTAGAVGGVAGMSAGFLIGSFVLPGVGSVAGAFIGGALSAVGSDAGETITGVVQDIKEGKGAKRNAYKLGGALAGAATGAGIGLAFGTIVPGVGNVVGAVVGGIIGGAIGWFGGGAAGVAVHDATVGAKDVQPKGRPLGGTAVKL